MINTELVFEKIALEHHTTVEEVRKEINMIIALSIKSDNPTAQEFWHRFSQKDTMPTADDLLLFCAEKIRSEENDDCESLYFNTEPSYQC